MSEGLKPVFKYQTDSRSFSDPLYNDYKSISTSKRVSDSGKFWDEIGNAISEIWHSLAEFIASVTKVWGIVTVKDPDSEKAYNYVVTKKTLEAFNKSSNIKEETQPKRNKIALKIFNINEKIRNFNTQGTISRPRNRLTDLVNFAHSSSTQLKLFEDDTYYTNLMASLDAYEREINEITQQISESNYQFELKNSELTNLKRKFHEFDSIIISEFTKPIEEQKRLIEEYDEINEQLKNTSKEEVESQINEYYSEVEKNTMIIDNSEDNINELASIKEEEVKALKDDCEKLQNDFICLREELSVYAEESTSKEKLETLSKMEELKQIFEPKKDKLKSLENKLGLIKEYEAKIAASRLELAQLNSEEKVEGIAKLQILKDAFENQAQRNSKLDEANVLLGDLIIKRTTMLGLRKEQEDEIYDFETKLGSYLNNQNNEINGKIAKLNSSQDNL